jgi:hypothetical protein
MDKSIEEFGTVNAPTFKTSNIVEKMAMPSHPGWQ